MAEPADSKTYNRDDNFVSDDSELESDFQSDLDDSDVQNYDDQFDDSFEVENQTWISWFLSHRENMYFCEIPADYIDDEFNLTGLGQAVNYYVEALDMMLDIEYKDDPLEGDELEAVEASAEILYGLIHARYILTKEGIMRMEEKYVSGDFGACPRYSCGGIGVLPCGRTDVPEIDSVKLFCPVCQDIYLPPSPRFQRIDGAYFGSTFPHMFLQVYPVLLEEKPDPPYVPRVYGFAINERSKSGPRMKWLRIRPETDYEKDEAGSERDQSADIQQDNNAGNPKDDEYFVAATNTEIAVEEEGDGMDAGTDRPEDISCTSSNVATPSAVLIPEEDEDAIMATASNSPKPQRSQIQHASTSLQAQLEDRRN